MMISWWEFNPPRCFSNWGINSLRFGQDALEENNDGLVESYVDGIPKNDLKWCLSIGAVLFDGILNVDVQP